jgi:hypothetical protein
MNLTIRTISTRSRIAIVIVYPLVISVSLLPISGFILHRKLKKVNIVRPQGPQSIRPNQLVNSNYMNIIPAAACPVKRNSSFCPYSPSGPGVWKFSEDCVNLKTTVMTRRYIHADS